VKAAMAAKGAGEQAGIRIVRGITSGQSGTVVIGLTIKHQPEPHDAEIQKEGLRIFVEEALVEALGRRTLDVRIAREGPELVFH
jgi:Fe-S cluster assembly iron-binding protein IscA